MAGTHTHVREAIPALHDALRIIELNRRHFGDRFPDDTTRDGSYPLRPATAHTPAGGNVGWTTAFWTGQLWLAWEHTNDDRFRQAAQQHVDSFAARIAGDVDCDHHDLGFLYTLSCVASARLDGSGQARTAALLAAERLMDRFLEPAGVFQAWGSLDSPDESGRVIIDSLMNMPLLYWATEQTGDSRFADAAHRHACRLRDHIVRDDSSSYHTFFFDVNTGEPLRGTTAQGHSNDSCWARGQAWGILGFALNYAATGDVSLLETARSLAEYFRTHLPADDVAYWDLAFGDGSGQPRDSSAAAIAACGLLELAHHGNPDATYSGLAHQIVNGLIAHYTPIPGSPGSPLLEHAVYNLPGGAGIDEGCLWGDYFYLEALTRVTRPEWHPYW